MNTITTYTSFATLTLTIDSVIVCEDSAYASGAVAGDAALSAAVRALSGDRWAPITLEMRDALLLIQTQWPHRKDVGHSANELAFAAEPEPETQRSPLSDELPTLRPSDLSALVSEVA